MSILYIGVAGDVAHAVRPRVGFSECSDFDHTEIQVKAKRWFWRERAAFVRARPHITICDDCLSAIAEDDKFLTDAMCRFDDGDLDV